MMSLKRKEFESKCHDALTIHTEFKLTPKTDIIKAIKNAYTTPDDPPPCPADQVISRTRDTFVSAPRRPEFKARYTTWLANLQRGPSCSPYQPYKPLGTPALEAADVAVGVMRAGLPDEFLEEFRRLHKDQQASVKITEKHEDRAASGKSAESERARCETRAREKAAKSAGMQDIRTLLRESERRIAACQAGQPYSTHVSACQKAKKIERRRKEKEETEAVGSMLLREISSHFMEDKAYSPNQSPGERQTHSSRARQRFSTALRKVNLGKFISDEPKRGRRCKVYLNKLDSIRLVLTSLHNMRTKHIKNKTVMSANVLKTLRKDPFAGGDKEFSKRMQNSLDWQSSSKRPSLGNQQMNSRRLSSNRTSGQIGMYSRDSIHPGSSKRKNSESPKHMGKGLFKGLVDKNKGIGLLSPAENRNLDICAFVVDTWDDLMRSRDGKPPKTGRLLSIRENEECSQTQLADKLVGNFKRDILNCKEKLRSVVNQELNRIEREQTVKSRYKLGAFDTMHPLLEIHMKTLQNIDQTVTRDPACKQEEGAKWYEKLHAERVAIGAAAVHDKTVMGVLEVISQFIRHDTAELPLVKEKLCLLTMSMPAFEICTPHMQNAIKFVLEEVLCSNVSHLNTWLTQRHMLPCYG